MKKRLLFAFMAMCVAVSGFALSNGEFVYTPQGRFQISGDNLNANNAFQDMTGWTVVSASTEKTLADNFASDSFVGITHLFTSEASAHGIGDKLWILDVDLIGRFPEAAADLIAVPIVGDAGIDLQAVPIRLHA